MVSFSDATNIAFATSLFTIQIALIPKTAESHHDQNQHICVTLIFTMDLSTKFKVPPLHVTSNGKGTKDKHGI